MIAKTLLVFAGLLAGLVGSQKGDAPLVMAAVAPNYPQLAVLSATVGEVNVDVVIDENGKVTGATIIKGHKLLDQQPRRQRYSGGLKRADLVGQRPSCLPFE